MSKTLETKKKYRAPKLRRVELSLGEITNVSQCWTDQGPVQDDYVCNKVGCHQPQ